MGLATCRVLGGGRRCTITYVCSRKKDATPPRGRRNKGAMSRTTLYYSSIPFLARNIIFIIAIVLSKCGSVISFSPSSSCNYGSFHKRRRSCGIVTVRRFAAEVQATGNSNDDMPDMSDVGFVILAGGTGSRMKATMPKQFLTLRGKPVLHHSMDLFLEQLPAFLKSRGKGCPPHVILVLDPMYQPEYQKFVDHYGGRLTFASPGKERQGSVENGLHALRNLAANTKYVAIHDSARPLVTIQEVCNVVNDAKEVGAAVLGVPCKATIKESEDGVLVTRTIPRSRLWEVHTPQGEQ
jgi:2-C-methyl-D-erythritol 4-phosphate cytidylyltransferase